MRKLLTINEASERIGRSPSMVRAYCDTGLLPGAEKYGRAWLIPEKALIGFTPPAKDEGGQGRWPRKKAGGSSQSP